MASVYDLKPKFQSLLRPMVSRLAIRGVTANQVTLSAVALSIIGGVAIATFPSQQWPLVLLPVILLFRMGLNAVDGMLAREFGQKSRLGAVLNELGDVISDVALYLPLACMDGVRAESVVAFVISAIVVEFTGVVAVQVSSARRYDGPMGKSDRAFWIGLLAVLLVTGMMAPAHATIYFWVLTFLAIPTIANRAKRALDEA